MRKFLIVMLVVLVGVMAAAVSAQDDMMMDSPTVSVLGIVDMDGIPDGVEADAWNAAAVYAVASEGEDGVSVTIFGANLIPDGLYTTWAVNEGTFGMQVAPAGGTPANEFTANADGFGTNQIVIAADEVPDALALAYHSDGQTYGDNPGPMGEVSFTHVMGMFPAMTEVDSSMLGIVDMDGIPEGIEADAWNAAKVVAVASEGEDGVNVTILASNLVPDGLYTTWAVNEGTFGMQVAPAGGTPENEFTANADGFGINQIVIAADEVPDALALAYHSDGQTYGDNPGPMGEVSFTHVMGMFPEMMGEME